MGRLHQCSFRYAGAPGFHGNRNPGGPFHATRALLIVNRLVGAHFENRAERGDAAGVQLRGGAVGSRSLGTAMLFKASHRLAGGPVLFYRGCDR